ncbi:complement factor H-related protein 4-like [Eriocheir sinensis]|uniref:complement factor H-related protein 4-like n=1 Tax=Eriocheir sinensis TaxID=95602 RepID=UPI0021C8EB59|nr:complement factor H-related protein 4-like [Eriocheir sinensis]
MTQGNGTRQVGHNLTYTCQPGTFIPPRELCEEPRTEVEVMCETNYTWTYKEDDLDCYPLCPDDPPYVRDNVTSSWDELTRLVGTQVNFTCPTNHTFPDLNDTVIVTCEDDGEWTTLNTFFLTCRIPCPDAEPFPTPDNATVEYAPSSAPYWVSDEFLYMCPDGYVSPLSNTNATQHCEEEDGWILSEPGFGCYKACLQDPQPILEPGNTTWDGFSRLVDTQVNLTCPVNHTFSDFNSTISLTCNEDGNWTYVDPELLVCRIACPEDPPEAPANATVEGVDPPYWVGDNLTVACEEGLGLEWGGKTVIIQCREDGWTELNPGFNCTPACDPPPLPPGRATYNHTGPTLWGVTIEYFCSFGFNLGPTNLTSTCKEGAWTRTSLPPCFGECHVL